MKIECADFYSLTELYDILHTPGTAREVDGLERIARKFAPGAVRTKSKDHDRLGGSPITGTKRVTESPVWLEPACGTGRYLRVLARRGYRAIGFDKSAEMVAYAEERLGARAERHGSESRATTGRATGGRAAARVFVAGMEDFDRRLRGVKVDFAFNLINTIRHLPSDRAMVAHFDAMARAMKKGAVYIVGLSLTAYGRERDDEDLWKGRRGATEVTQIVQYLPPPPEVRRGPGARTERVISHLVVRSGERTRDITSAYTLRCYSLKQWMKVVEKSALEVLASIDEDGNDHLARDGGYCVFVLGRRGGRW
ncbi:MAG: methyltransferase domain-containing protein [Phycisphaerales bacterium]|nr:methyltransferase domain-containing protein [Phycisphaerales bacterium]